MRGDGVGVRLVMQGGRHKHDGGVGPGGHPGGTVECVGDRATTITDSARPKSDGLQRGTSRVSWSVAGSGGGEGSITVTADQRVTAAEGGVAERWVKRV